MKLLKFLSVLLIFSCTKTPEVEVVFAEDNEVSKSNTVDTVSNSGELIEVVKAYFEAYEDADLSKVSDLEHDDVTFYTASGEIIKGKDEHIRLIQAFLIANENIVLDIKWSTLSNANPDKKPGENWVLSALELSYGPDTARTEIKRIADLMLVDRKIKRGYIYGWDSLMSD